jgi:colicin import membrane protein
MSLNSQEGKKMSTSLVHVEQMPALEIFKPGAIDQILTRIEAEAREEAAKLDISTDPGRKAIASLAYKVARSKTYIDDQGKTLTEDARKQIEAVNGERKIARDRLDALKDEVRKPLTDWEQADKDRCAGHEKALKEIEGAGTYTAQNWQKLSSEAIADRITEIEIDERNWEEFGARAAGVKAVALNAMKQALEDSKKLEAERAEMKRLKALEAERIVAEREAAAARAATEAAEKKARDAAEAVQRAADAERERIEREHLAAEARAKQAEAQRIADAEFAERKRVAQEQELKRQLELAEARRLAEEQAAKRREEEAAAQAKRDQEAAIERERQRVADEAERVRVATEKREASKRHVAKIQREAKMGLVAAGLSSKDAEAALAYIVGGQVPHVSIQY